MRRTFLRLFSGACLAAALAGLASLPAQAQAQAASASSFEIAGVRIGMTEAEARSALRAFDSSLSIRPVMAVFNYSDGVNHALRTPEFLGRLEAWKDNQRPVVKVYFSGPVGDVRVISVRRDEILVQNRPTAAQFAQDLIRKYGRPAGINGTRLHHIVWEDAGRPSCIRVREAGKITFRVDSGAGMAEHSTAEAFYVGRSKEVEARGLLPADLTQCGAYVDYYLLGDPVSTFAAELNDLGAIITAERSRKAWVQQLKDAATRKRQGQGQTPRL
ncbi:hypothetical protein [Phenylobacterium sp.]|uniref:hypothetical protein n=1 Tax=Phenylobacterium sp. TaxID=1871053 RepID=UPI00301E425B